MAFFDSILCNNQSFPHRPGRILYRRSKQTWQYISQSPSEEDAADVAVSCPECKHVYMYEYQPDSQIDVPEILGSWAASDHTAELVPLVCGKAGCGVPLLVHAPRAAGVTKKSVCKEVSTWKLRDLYCPQQHQILVPRILPG